MVNKLVVGLGNPGKKYSNTKHNLGFMVLDSYAKSKKIKFKKSLKYNAEIAEIENYILLKPKTYMNNSGIAVEKVVNYYRIIPGNILVIHDDVDLPFGRLKLKQKGGSGGHNGIKSIINYLGTEEFKRLRFGIDNKEEVDTKDYVLSNLYKQEEKKAKNVVIEAMQVITDFLSDMNFEQIMTTVNAIK